MAPPVVVLAGATGSLGGRVAEALLGRGASVRAIVRRGGGGDTGAALRALGASIAEADYGSAPELARACAGASCVVSTLSGLREVIVDAQTRLLAAAVDAGVPRFIPSDYCIDFTKLPPGGNRNLDLRREFHERLDASPVAATSILNGMFSDLLTGQAPMVLFGRRRVLYWGDVDQPMDFTTMDDTAAFTSAAALDASAPRFLRVAGDELSAGGLAAAASAATGETFRPLRAGGIGRLGALITLTRILVPGRRTVFPPWQGMQYIRDMASGLAKLAPLDNDRYPGMRWTPVREVLEARA